MAGRLVNPDDERTMHAALTDGSRSSLDAEAQRQRQRQRQRLRNKMTKRGETSELVRDRIGPLLVS
jgi:hypothetical protein